MTMITARSVGKNMIQKLQNKQVKSTACIKHIGLNERERERKEDNNIGDHLHTQKELSI